MAAVRITPLLLLVWRVHRWLFRVSGGRIGTRMNGFPILLLTTLGRRSGEERPATLQYLAHGDGWAVIGSKAGDDRHPAWWLNLQADPEAATVLLRGRTIRVRAREAAGGERQELWERFTAIDDSYDEYLKRTDRRIPVVVLERRQGTV